MDDVRIDKWLWAARCFKTRTAATEACDGGHVQVDGAKVKPARRIQPGVMVEVLTPGGPRKLKVVALGDRRGSATVAATLYEDLTPPPEPRDLFDPERPRGGGRPTGRDRRLLNRLRRT